MANLDLRPSKKKIARTARADKIFNQLIEESGLTEEFQKRYIASHWKELFGPLPAKHVKVINLEQKKLHLYCDNPVWSDTVNLTKLSIIDTINKFAGGDLVRDILFTNCQSPKASFTAINRDFTNSREEDRMFANRLQKMHLNDEEIQKIKDISSAINDEELRKKLQKLQMNHNKLHKLHLADGWQPCPNCGRFMEPERTICFECQQEKKAQTDLAIRSILTHEPWLKYQDIVKRINCSSDDVSKVRAYMVKEACLEIDMDKSSNIDAIYLTMLFKEIPPSVILKKPEKVTAALKQLRHDIGDKYFKYMENHPEETAVAKRAKKVAEYKPKKEYTPSKEYTPKKRYVPPAYVPGQVRELLKDKKK